MANEQDSLIYTLGVMPGIKRDGTVFESREFSDGVWCRFQRGVPKKMGGYRQMFKTPNGIPRGIIMNAYNGVNYIFTGNQNGIDVFTTGTTLGIGSGPFRANIEVGNSSQALVSNTTTQFVVAGDQTAVYTTGTKVIFSQTPGSQIYAVSTSSYSSPNTTVTIASGVITGSPTDVWLANWIFQPSAENLWQLDMQYSPMGEELFVIAHPGRNLANIDSSIDVQVYVGNLLPGVDQSWTFTGLVDSGGANPTNLPIAVDGGACVVYPFLFVYGSNGYIANNHVANTYGDQDFTDWNGPTANQVNMAAGKIVKGMPVRGGTYSPSALFWATDSLIRASFTGQEGLYWRYDIISSQISIMSSSSVVEMDGVYYWMGVDRFYAYNGNVQVLDNDKNVNYLFNNLNYEQRQKVWATKVPRYNEIWFFYPRGTELECTDAIIYNVKDKIWYDAGQAVGARRSCGYTTEVFPTPIWCGWEYEEVFGTQYHVIDTPSGETAPNANQFYINGDVSNVFFPGAYLAFSTEVGEPVYQVATSDFIFNTNTLPNGATLVTATENFSPAPSIDDHVYFANNGYSIWQQEFQYDMITDQGTFAVPSSITTCDISWVGGNPAQDAPAGINRRMHLRRVEPDFLQAGSMQMDVLGRPFARGTSETAGPFVFDPDTGKIDLRLEFREIRLQFTSNTVGGNFEMGRILITAELGDERP